MRTLTFVGIAVILSCTSAPSLTVNGEAIEEADGEQGGSSHYKEGTDYHILQRVRLMDQSGFGRPAEAASFLLPKGWRLTGGIQWRVGHPCMNESVAAQWSATSPDGAMELRGFPVRSWQWHDDQQVVQDMMRNQQGIMKSCDIMPPYDAEAFVREQVLQELGGASIVSAEPAAALVPAAAFTLAQNRPNPFNPRTRIAFTLAEPGTVSLAVYDASGRQVRRLTDGLFAAGAHEAVWQGDDEQGGAVASGTYFYRLRTAAGEQTRKMTLLR